MKYLKLFEYTKDKLYEKITKDTYEDLKSKIINIDKHCEDDEKGKRYYKCDQWDGLLKCLDEEFNIY